MMDLYNSLKKMMPVAEALGKVHEAHMGEWVCNQEHISLRGVTADGRKFELSLEIDKEGEQDAN